MEQLQNRTESTAVLRVRLSNPCHPCVNVELLNLFCQDDVDETAATWLACEG